MTEAGPSSFAALLHRLRLAAGFTQEDLAERAQLSVRAIRDLERDRGRTPRLHTVWLLAQALDLGEVERSRLLTAARPAPVGDDGPLPSHVQPPRFLTPLIGRTEDVAILKMLLDDRRLVTLSGTGGVGKTRLALALAEQMTDGFDRIVFVELASLPAPGHVLGTIAASLFLREEGAASLFDLVAGRLRSRRTLLVLDSMEHLLASYRTVLDLLSACPNLSILVTSREALHVRGERVYTLGPLRLPEREADIPRSPAVQLFLQRAREAGAEVELDEASTSAVAELCHRLDGLPLAIELAAAWTPLLAPPALVARLTTRLPYLDHGSRDLPARQRTMRDTIAWSYNLLNLEEQAIFRRLSVFSGGWTLEAAMALCAEPELDAGVPVGLAGLRSKNLVSEIALGKAPTREPRLAMLETIREYGLAMLAIEGEEQTAHNRYLAYYRAYAEGASRHTVGPDRAAWRERFEREHDNLRGALRMALDGADLAAAQELVEGLWRFWSLSGYLSEGRQWLRRVLDLIPEGEQASAGVLTGAASLALEQGDFEESASLGHDALMVAGRQQREREIVLALNVVGAAAWRRDCYDDGRRHHEEALRLARTIGHREGELDALSNLVMLAVVTGNAAGAVERAQEAVAGARALGDPHAIGRALADRAALAREIGWHDQADALMEEALELLRSVGDAGKVAEALFALGTGANFRRQYERAARLLEECLAMRTARGDEITAGATRGALGVVLLNMGDLDRAGSLLAESYRSCREHGVRMGEAIALAFLGHLALAQGDVPSARRAFIESASLLESIANRRYLPWCLEGLAGVACLEQRWDLAARLCGVRERLLDQLDSSAAPACPDAFDGMVVATHAVLGDEAFETCRAEGRTLDVHQVMAQSSSRG